MILFISISLFAQEEYTCNVSVNNLPQVGLKEDIFEVLGKPPKSWIGCFGHWGVVYEDGNPCTDCPLRMDTINVHVYEAYGLTYYERNDSLFLCSVKFNQTTYDSCCIQIGDDCLNENYSMDSFIESF